MTELGAALLDFGPGGLALVAPLALPPLLKRLVREGALRTAVGLTSVLVCWGLAATSWVRELAERYSVLGALDPTDNVYTVLLGSYGAPVLIMLGFLALAVLLATGLPPHRTAPEVAR